MSEEGRGFQRSITTLARVRRQRGERMRQKEGAEHQWLTPGERDRDGSSLHFFWLFASLLIGSAFVLLSLLPAFPSQLSLSVLLSLTYGYLTVGFSFRRVSSSSSTPPLSLFFPSLLVSSLHHPFSIISPLVRGCQCWKVSGAKI